jgi:hypothetical protein
MACHIRIDPDEDTIFLPFNFTSFEGKYYRKQLLDGTLWKQEVCDRIHYLAIDSKIENFKNLHYLDISRYKYLKELTIILHTHYCNSSGEHWEFGRPDRTVIMTFAKSAEDLEEDVEFKEDFEKRIGRIQKEHPEWHKPEVKFRYLGMDGFLCCSFDWTGLSY